MRFWLLEDEKRIGRGLHRPPRLNSRPPRLNSSWRRNVGGLIIPGRFLRALQEVVGLALLDLTEDTLMPCNIEQDATKGFRSDFVMPFLFDL